MSTRMRLRLLYEALCGWRTETAGAWAPRSRWRTAPSVGWNGGEPGVGLACRCVEFQGRPVDWLVASVEACVVLDPRAWVLYRRDRGSVAGLTLGSKTSRIIAPTSLTSHRGRGRPRGPHRC